ncbi:MAG: serine/threonine-protein kinase [Myxococcota bacterium]|nr:serine/threonine-protein kinase [Myxococcota bacterium]
MYPPVPHQARFGPYLILRKIGEGAMSKVYLAHHTGALAARGEVALKVLRHEYSNQPETLALLKREALIGQKMHHPNVISTLEFGEIDGLPYMAMDYVKGVTVADLLDMVDEKGRGLPPELAACVLVQVCAGLNYAHSLTDHTGKVYGVVHRDLKPGNVMVSLSGVAKVMDFGVAKIKAFSDTVTTVRKTRGTPAYMSPEQANGDPLTHHSDIFAAGLMLYELLTGSRPFEADNLNDLIRKVREASLLGHDDRLEEYGAGLGRIFRRATHFDAERRYPDASWMKEDLEQIFPADTPIPLPSLEDNRTQYYTIEEAGSDEQKFDGAMPAAPTPPGEPGEIPEIQLGEPRMPRQPPPPVQLNPSTPYKGIQPAAVEEETEDLDLDPETYPEIDLGELPELDLDDETIPEVDLGPPVFLELHPKPDPKVPQASDTLTHLTQFLIEIEN